MSKTLQFLLRLSLFLLPALSIGQNRQNEKWYFGYNAGVDFGTGIPVAITNSAIFTSEGSAAVADRLTGDLLFYTNGLTIWNSQNLPMPNGSGLLGGIPANTSSTTAARIVPRPGNPDQYYVFTVDEFGGPNGLRSNLVDMTLNGGLGDVVSGQKNILISNNDIAEKLDYAPMANGAGYWLVTRQVNGNQYMAWQVTSAGISATPVVSTAGTSTFNGAGYLKFNWNHTMLANAIVFGTVDVLSFDNTTGQITNILNLPVPMGSSVYGVEFSPSGRYLYVSNFLDGIYQFDLNAPNVAASRQVVAPVFATALQLGPDCKIYAATAGLDAIPDPDLPVPACGYVSGAVNLQPGGSSYGLPMKVIFLDEYRAQINVTGSSLCAGAAIPFELTGLNLYPQAVRWTFGDPASGSSDSASALATAQVTHLYNQPGQYVVRAIYEYNCRLDTVFDTVTVSTCNPLSPNCVAFQCTGAPQQWTVPVGVDTIRVKMWGAAGGGGPDAINNAGGGGGYTEFVLPVVAGDVLQIAVGCGGNPAVGHIGGAGGWPAGGSGGSGNRVETVFGIPTDVGGAGGGGGLSLVRILGSQNAILGIAGAGGGGSFKRSGGAGGGLNADYTVTNNSFNIFGFGGTQTAGGAPASNTICPNPVFGTAGGFQQGGTGATDLGGGVADRTGGGGGGDGYYGGGGGSSHDGCFSVGSAGGGGSGFVCSTCPGLFGTTVTGGIAGTPANDTDPLLGAFPGVGRGTDNAQGGSGLVYICYDSIPCSPTTSGFSVEACSSYVAPNGAVLIFPGLYIITIPNSAGCDSVITILLTFTGPVFGTPIIASSCNSYTAPWGTTYAQSGTYFDTLTTAAGCDSILTLILTITGNVSGNPIIASACDSYTAPWGTTYTQSGTYFDTLTTAAGCDSILTLILTITGNVSGNPIIASACNSYTAPWGTTYTQSGTYFDTLTTVAGCDSIVSLILSISGNVIGPSIIANACDSYSAPWGTIYSQSGLYSDTLTSVNGCDSLLTVNLTINTSPVLTVNTTPDSCSAGVGSAQAVATGTGNYSYFWSNGGSSPLVSGLTGGNYSVIVTDLNGCSDSASFAITGTAAPIIVASASSLVINPGDSVQLFSSGANSFTWQPAATLSCSNCPSPFAAPTQTTTYVVTGTATNGCASVAALTITVDIACSELFLPNIFSPDGTGPQENEQLCVLSNCIEQMDLAIYDRWGQIIFQTNDPKQCWNGQKDGKEVMTGVYAFRLFVKQLDGKEIRKSGTVTLVK